MSWYSRSLREVRLPSVSHNKRSGFPNIWDFLSPDKASTLHTVPLPVSTPSIGICGYHRWQDSLSSYPPETAHHPRTAPSQSCSGIFQSPDPYPFFGRSFSPSFPVWTLVLSTSYARYHNTCLHQFLPFILPFWIKSIAYFAINIIKLSNLMADFFYFFIIFTYCISYFYCIFFIFVLYWK